MYKNIIFLIPFFYKDLLLIKKIELKIFINNKNLSL